MQSIGPAFRMKLARLLALAPGLPPHRQRMRGARWPE
jgi:hypothetical protein